MSGAILNQAPTVRATVRRVWSQSCAAKPKRFRWRAAGPRIWPRGSRGPVRSGRCKCSQRVVWWRRCGSGGANWLEPPQDGHGATGGIEPVGCSEPWGVIRTAGLPCAAIV